MAFSSTSQRALKKAAEFGDEQYWKLFREILRTMSGETKLTAIDAEGLASGSIRICGNVGDHHLILTLKIEEKED